MDSKKSNDKLYPLLLPKSKDNNISFFILVYESNKESSSTLWGEISDRQYVIKYDPYCGGDDDDSFELIQTYNYMTSSPTSTSKNIYESYTDVWDYDDGNLKSTKKFINKYRKQAEKEYLEKVNKDVMFFNKLSELTISAVVELVDHWYNKDDVEPASKIMWSHPHKFIRKELGKEGDILDYNIAEILYYQY